MPYSNDFFYRIYPNGNTEKTALPLILIHGSGGSHMAWPAKLRRMPGQPVIALDLPGHGKSSGPACNNLNTLVNQLEQFMQELGIYHMLLAGHSLGSILALNFALKYPERVRGMLLLSCGSYFKVPESLFEALQNPDKKDRFIEAFNRIAFDPNFPQESRRLLLEPLRKIRASTLLADLSICAKFHIAGAPGKITCPVSLINGASDVITGPTAARQLNSYFPDSTLKILPGCGHLLLYEKITLISNLTRDFFDSIKTR